MKGHKKNFESLGQKRKQTNQYWRKLK